MVDGSFGFNSSRLVASPSVVRVLTLNMMSPAGADPCVSAAMSVPLLSAMVSDVIEMAGDTVSPSVTMP